MLQASADTFEIFQGLASPPLTMMIASTLLLAMLVSLGCFKFAASASTPENSKSSGVGGNNAQWSLLARPSDDVARRELLRIDDLEVRCQIGFNAHEIGKLQRVLIGASFRPPAPHRVVDGGGDCGDEAVDDVSTTVDLRSIGKDLSSTFEGEHFNLIETMAYVAAYVACVVHGCRDVVVTVKKPGSLRFSKGTEVQVGPYNAEVRVM